ncbi:MAG TPA: SgcJ/EcaC family oxidoreductase [Rhodanobacteraceae bacterium]|nr:SgcJ/EcaC family oxidoreductase [Rhodanobacteraceae bacterium]
MQTSSVAEDLIRDLLEAQIAAWNAGDAEGWCKDFTHDSEFVNIIGARFENRDANVRRHAELFATIFKGSRLAVREMRIRMLGDFTACADLVLDLTGFSQLPPGIRPSIGDDVLRTRMHYVLVRDGAHWRIVFSQNNAVMPLPLPE